MRLIRQTKEDPLTAEIGRNDYQLTDVGLAEAKTCRVCGSFWSADVHGSRHASVVEQLLLQIRCLNSDHCLPGIISWFS